MNNRQYLHTLKSNNLYKNCIHVISFILLLLLISNVAYANYSERYDKEVALLVVTEPKKALLFSQNKLKKARLSQNFEDQLVALFYMANALDVLSKQDELDEVISQGLKLANEQNNLRFKSEFLGLTAYRLELKGRYLEAVNMSNQALQYAQETYDDRIYAEQLAQRGEIQMAIENYDFALKDVEKALKIFKLNNDKENLSLNYNLLAIIYSSISDYDNAIKYYGESEIYDLVKSSYNQAALYYNLGSVYFSKDDYDQAISYYTKSSDLSKQTNDTYTLAFTKYGLAEVYLLQDEFEKAEAELVPVFEIFENNNDILMLFNSNLVMADIKIANKLYDDATKYIEMAEKQSEIINTPSVKLNVISQKTIYHVAKEEWEEAFRLNKHSKKIRDAILKRDKEQLISELKIRYNAQFDQEKMDLLESQNQLQQTVILQDKATKKYLWGLLLLGLIVILITYLGYRNQRKTKRYLYKLSITDYLTRVANRRHIIERLKELHLKSKNENLSFTLIMVDLDYFKSINDNYGHDIGNEVLIYFARTAQRVMSDIGEVGRIGGEEWLVLVHSIDLELIKSKLAELRADYKDAISIKIPDDCILSFSSGALTCTGQYKGYEKMLSDVDTAMYQAKEKGREQDVFI